MIFVVPTNGQSDYLGGLVWHEAADAFVLVVAGIAIVVRNIRVQQTAVLTIVGLTTWIYLGSARVFH